MLSLLFDNWCCLVLPLDCSSSDGAFKPSFIDGLWHKINYSILEGFCDLISVGRNYDGIE